MSKTKIALATLGVVGLAAVPVTGAFAVTSNTIVNGYIDASISITSSTPVEFHVLPTAGGTASTNSGTVTVSTNNSTGYNLTLSTVGTDQNLVKSVAPADTIAPTSGTYAAPADFDVNTWGYRLDDSTAAFGAGPTTQETNAATSSFTWAAVPGSGAPQTIKTTTGPATSDVTAVWYGMKATTAKPSGVYTNTVVYTATVN